LAINTSIPNLAVARMALLRPRQIRN